MHRVLEGLAYYFGFLGSEGKLSSYDDFGCRVASINHIFKLI
jgi:hypothetical protein